MGVNRYYSSVATATTLAAGIGATDVTLMVASATGLPSSYPFTLILDADTASVEIVEVVAVVGNSLTITRGVDGTAPLAHSSGATITHGVSARDFREPQEHIASDAGVHGLGAGVAVVGTTATQTLTNKAIDGDVNTLTNVPAGQVTGLHNEGVFVASADGNTPLTARWHSATQSANFQEWQDSTGAILARIDKTGAAYFRTSNPSATNAADIPLSVKAAAGQTANISQWLSSTNTVLAAVDKDGKFSARNGKFTSGAVGDVPLISKGFSGQTGDLFQVQDSTGAVLTRMDLLGKIFGAPATFTSVSTGDVALTVTGASGQTADLAQLKNNAGTVLAKVDKDGNFYATNVGRTLVVDDSFSGVSVAGTEVTLKSTAVTIPAELANRPIEVEVILTMAGAGSSGSSSEPILKLQYDATTLSGSGARINRDLSGSTYDFGPFKGYGTSAGSAGAHTVAIKMTGSSTAFTVSGSIRIKVL